MPARRSVYAPRGRTPTLEHQAAHRRKVNLISAVLHHPGGRVELRWRADAIAAIDNDAVAAFLRELHAVALAAGSGGLAVVWDNGNNHRGEPIRAVCRELAGTLWLWNLPPYSPDFNPDELIWRQLKHLPDLLLHYAARTIDELLARATTCLAWLAADPPRLRNTLRTATLDWLSLLNGG